MSNDERKREDDLVKRLGYLADVVTPWGQHIALDARDRIEELEAKLAKVVDVEEAQQFFNHCAVEVLIYGASIDRLQNLNSAWVNLQTQYELAELKGEGAGDD